MDIDIKNYDLEEIWEEFSKLEDNRDLANLLEINPSTLNYYAYRLNKEKQYKKYEIPKRKGGVRIIHAPISNLKIIQHKLNFILQKIYSPRKCSFAFSKKRNIIQNANTHKKSKVILKIDLKDFFDQINFGRVRGIFMSQYPFGLNDKVSTTLANICILDNKLPQGAPTSPIISNIVCWSLDRDLERLCRRLRCKYTRYADDITISTKSYELPEAIAVFKNGEYEIGEKLLQYFEKHKFKINFEKVKVIKSNKRQLVTGLVTNEFANVKREYVDEIRKELYIWEKYGLQELDKRIYPKNKKPTKLPMDYKWTLFGKLNYIKQVKGKTSSTYKTLKHWADYLILRDRYEELKLATNYQTRGYALENLLSELFLINNFEVERPFTRIVGADKIDGGVVLNGRYFIIEAKWTDIKDINQEIKAFQQDVQTSGGNTLGIFISAKGWNKNAITNIQSSTNKNVLLINGKDLETILTNRKLDIRKLLEWKLKNFSFKVKPYSSAKEFLKQNPIQIN